MLLNAFVRGQPLVTKAAAAVKYGVFPGAMIAALIFTPPDYIRPKKPANSNSN